MSGKTENAQISALIERAGEIHFAGVVRRARTILNKRKTWSFCMAMGSASFHDARGPVDYNNSALRGFYAFLYEWDSMLYTTGVPVRIIRDATTGALVQQSNW